MPENSEHELEEEAKPLSYDEIKSKLEEKITFFQIQKEGKYFLLFFSIKKC